MYINNLRVNWVLSFGIFIAMSLSSAFVVASRGSLQKEGRMKAREKRSRSERNHREKPDESDYEGGYCEPQLNGKNQSFRQQGNHVEQEWLQGKIDLGVQKLRHPKETNDPIGAELIALEIIKKYPDHPEAWKIYLSAVHQQEKRYEIMKAVDKVIQVAPGFRQSYGIGAVTCLDLRLFSKALKYAEMGLALYPNDRHVRGAKARALSGLGWKDQALAEARQLSLLYPHDEAAHGTEAFILTDLRRFDEALAIVQRQLDWNPYNQIALGMKLKILTEAHRFKEAKAVLNQITQFGPLNRVSMGLAARLHFDMGHYEDALQLSLREMQLYPSDVHAYGIAYVIYTRLERHAEALQVAREKVRLNDDDLIGHMQIGQSLLSLGRREEALKEFALVRGRDPARDSDIQTILRKFK